MKKFLLTILSFIFCISLGVTIYADEFSQTTYTEMDEDIIAVLYNCLSEEDHEILSSIQTEGRPVLKVYYTGYFEHIDADIQNMIEQALLYGTVDYIVFSENENIRWGTWKDGENITVDVITIRGSNYSYINDIRNMAADTEILGQTCQVSNIYCFDDLFSHRGAAVYVVTDQGSFVRYYDSAYSEGIWFKEEDFSAYAVEYYNFLISPENNYNEDGEPVGGMSMTFVEFIEELRKQEELIEQDECMDWKSVFIYGGITIVLAGILITAFVLRKRTQKKLQNEE